MHVIVFHTFIFSITLFFFSFPFSPKGSVCVCVSNIYVHVCVGTYAAVHSVRVRGQLLGIGSLFAPCGLCWFGIKCLCLLSHLSNFIKYYQYAFSLMVAGPCPSTLFWTKYPMHAGQYSTTDQAAFFSSAFVYLEKKLYLYSTCEKTWRNKTKAVVLSHSCPPICPFFV